MPLVPHDYHLYQEDAGLRRLHVISWRHFTESMQLHEGVLEARVGGHQSIGKPATIFLALGRASTSEH